jgi:hypothetical protein
MKTASIRSSRKVAPGVTAFFWIPRLRRRLTTVNMGGPAIGADFAPPIGPLDRRKVAILSAW